MSQDCCSICLEPLIHFSGGRSARPIGASSCGHCLHVECFARWKESKSNPFYEDDDDECPCPNCNQPIHEFVRLYISGDKTENDRLKKELKLVKRKLAHERSRLQQTQRNLLQLVTADAGRVPRNSERSSARRTSHNMERTETPVTRGSSGSNRSISLHRSESNSDRRVQASSQDQSSRYRRHESCPSYFDSGSDADRERPVDPEPATTAVVQEARPDPPSPWILGDDYSDDEDDYNADGDKLSSWVDRMAIAVMQPTSLLSSFSSQTDGLTCGGE